MRKATEKGEKSSKEVVVGKLADKSKPNPGGSEAGKMGCLCPIYPNDCGRGYSGGPPDCKGCSVWEGYFVVFELCPVHGWKSNH